MHKNKFTPGDWVYPKDSSGAPDLAIFAKNKPMGTPKGHDSKYGAVICHVVMYDALTGFLSKKEYEHNAQLISAAPQLYAVCEKLEEYAKLQNDKWQNGWDAEPKLWNALIEALKVARGQNEESN